MNTDNLDKKADNLTRKTIKAHLKHFGLTISKDGMIWKGGIALDSMPEDKEKREQALFYFLQGMSAGLDNLHLFKEVAQ